MNRRWGKDHPFYQRGRELRVKLQVESELLYGKGENETDTVDGDEMWFDQIHKEVGLIHD